MKYLILTAECEEEICYNLADIVKINCDYAENILSEPDLKGNDIKPLELLMVISFKDGSTATFSAAKWEMYFD